MRTLFLPTMDLYTPGCPKWRKVARSAYCAVLSTPVSLPTNSPELSKKEEMLKQSKGSKRKKKRGLRNNRHKINQKYQALLCLKRLQAVLHSTNCC